MRDAVDVILGSPWYTVLVIFVGGYPLFSALYWITASLVFSFHRERRDDAFYAIDEAPFVSVLMAAHNEEAVIEETVEQLLALDWPEFEVVVVDDGSTDATPAILRRFSAAGRIRLLRKETNEGKAMALNDALPLLRGEIILLVDADGRPQPDVLRYLVPHFVRVPRVAAVTGNPRVANTNTILTWLQAIEFSATVSVLRRAQSTWGRLMTFSGISTALRKSAVEAVGRFRPEMATEDIALTWQLQRAYFDVRYEPRAVFGMEVPETLGAWWRQRRRWAFGMGQVLRRNASIFRSWKARRLWPVYIEALLSGLWSHLFLLMVALGAAAYPLGVYDFGANPIPNFWGMLIASIAVVQIFCGLWMDGRYDPFVRRSALWLPLYPLLYWMLTALVAVSATASGVLRKPSGAVTWTHQRYGAGTRPA